MPPETTISAVEEQKSLLLIRMESKIGTSRSSCAEIFICPNNPMANVFVFKKQAVSISILLYTVILTKGGETLYVEIFQIDSKL